MDENRVKEYLQSVYDSEIPALVNRDILLPDTSKIVTLIGPRRAGKTYLMYQKIKELLAKGVHKNNILYINCEHPRLFSVGFEELYDVVKMHWRLYPSKEKKFYLFIDEPQVITKWESAVRMFHDESMNIFLSGSSSKLLSKEIATSLRGRCISYLVLPFSFKEYLRLREFNEDIERLGGKNKSLLMHHLDEYTQLGGYPEIIKESDPLIKERIINDYFELVVFKDIIDRYKIKNTKLVKWLINSCILSASSELSVHKTYLDLKSRGLKASKNTLYSYLSLLEDALMIFIVSKYVYSVKKVNPLINKIYIDDTCFFKCVDSSKNVGKKMENMVYLELMRRKNPLANIHYYKNIQGEEVDFVITEGNKVMQLIQVCQKLDDIDTKQREIRALLKAGSELKCKKLIIITEDYQGTEEAEWFGNKGKIEYIPIWKWLLK
jgi:predicted AAA+ superfamily ATPase